ncbi:MAG: hypothetical protein ABI589_12260 [Burkholderiales bacterium]
MNITLPARLCSFMLVVGSAAAAAAAPPGHPPTRMQVCQNEVQGADGERRKSQLRECLSRRAEGEQAVAADCQRQLRLGPRRSAAQERQLRDCEARALAVPSSQLPRRPPPPLPEARPMSQPAGTAVRPQSAPLRGPAPSRPPVVAPREGA